MRFYQSLRFQVVATLLVIVAAVSLVLTWLVPSKARDVLVDHELVDLFDETNLQARELVAELQTFREETLRVALEPKVRALLDDRPDRKDTRKDTRKAEEAEAGREFQESLDRRQRLLQLEFYQGQRDRPALFRTKTADQKPVEILGPKPDPFLLDVGACRDGVCFSAVRRARINGEERFVLQAGVPTSLRHAKRDDEVHGLIIATLDLSSVIQEMEDSPRHLTFMRDHRGTVLMYPRKDRAAEPNRVLGPGDAEKSAVSAADPNADPNPLGWLLSIRDTGFLPPPGKSAMRVESRYRPRRVLQQETESGQPPPQGGIPPVADDDWAAPADFHFHVLRARISPDLTAGRRSTLLHLLREWKKRDGLVIPQEIKPETEQLLVRHWDRARLDDLWADLKAAFGSDLQRLGVVHCKTFARVMYRCYLTPDRGKGDQRAGDADPCLYFGMAVAREEVEADINDVQGAMQVFAGLSTAIALLVGMLFVRWLTGPIGRMTTAVTLYGQGDAAAARAKLPIRVTSEIGQLARQFDQMIGQVEGQKARLKSVLSAAGDAFITLDRDKLIWTFNPAATEMFGYAESEIERRHIGQLITKDENHAPEDSGSGSQNILADLTTGRVREAVGWRKDRAPFPVEYRGNRVGAGENETYTLVVRDITERRKLEAAERAHTEQLERLVGQRTAELRQANEELKQADQLKNDFLAIVSHELRAPLTVVFGYAQSLQRTPLADTQTRYVAKVLEGAQSLKDRVDDLLEYIKLLKGKIELHPETFGLADFLREVGGDFVKGLESGPARRPLAERNNQLVIDCPPDLGEVHTDRGRLRQVLDNLLGNAAKFTRDGTITLWARRRPAPGGPDRVVIEVRDTGIGIRADDLRKLFQPFAKLADQEHNLKGTGLGLAICRELCERMGGDITAESQFGHGSTFTCTIPVTAPAAACAPAARPAAPRPARPAEPPGSNRRVLVVDDDTDLLDLMRRNLEDQGFQVSTAQSGPDALAVVGKVRPAVILLDVLMPGGISGWTVLAALKDDPDTTGIPVIMISMLDDRSKGISRGAVDYVVKPVKDWAQLARLIRRHQTGGRRVLLVDDDPAVRELCARALADDGWQVVEAEHGAAGLDRLREEVPALILLDLLMPVMDGIEFLGRLRAEPAWRHIPVVVLTAKHLTDEDRRRLNGSVQQVILKGGYDRAELLREIGEQVRRHVTPAASEGGDPWPRS